MIDKVYIKGKEVQRITINNGIYYENKEWYEEYGVLADCVISNGVDNWIDTLLPLNTFKDGVVIEMDIEYLTIPNTEINAMGGVSGTSSSRNVIEAGSIVGGDKAFYSYTSSGVWNITEFIPKVNTKYKLRYNFRQGLQIMYVDDVEVYRTTDNANITSSAILSVFARTYNNTRTGYSNIKWRSLKLSKLDGTLIADYIPLYVSKKPILDSLNNEYGVGSYILADNVSRKATILYGEPLEGYVHWWQEFGVRGEYIENTVIGSYIKTDFYPNITTAPLTKFRIKQNIKSGSGYKISGIGGSNPNTTMYVGSVETNQLVYGNFDTNVVVDSFIVEPDTMYDFVVDYVNKVVNINDKKITDIQLPVNFGGTGKAPFVLGGYNSGGSNEHLFVARCLWRIEIGEFYVSENLIYNLIPIQVTKEFTDLKGIAHNAGDWIMVNELTSKDVPTHVGEFTGGGINQELSWFETVPNSTGIKTNFIPTSVTAPLTKIELMCSFTRGSSGYLVNGVGGGPTMYIGMNPSARLAYGNLGTDSSIAYSLSYDTYYKLTIDYKNKTISVNDVVVVSNITVYSYSKNNVNFGLNCYVNTVSGAIFNNWGQKTQYCKIYVDDVLTHHWVGKLNDDKVDVYDKVEEVYLGDLGLIEGIENIIAGEFKK